ncbi:hypothetical protein F5X96DRAFT_475600 [Biscogniauxia mediterranea]|nr:hypothetical protein F5X96DRAFT_475600 [Biscogniauxia mediterranea]
MSGNWTASISPGILPQSTSAVMPAATPNMMAEPPTGPPYRANIAIVGGVPVPDVDDPIAAVFVFLFLASAAAHMTILQVNKRRGLKFLFSGMLFVLCMLRTVALIVRMVWASNSMSTKVAIAANILAQTGSVLVFVINLFLAQRIVRACHASFGWHQVTRIVFRFLIACVVCCLIMIITVTVQSFYTLDPGIRESDRDVQLFAGTYLALLAFLPIPVVLLVALLPRTHHIDKFGAGRWRSKLCLLLFTSLVATLGAGFRIATNFAPRPMTDPAWYHSRACFYCFNFVTDLVISTAYLLARFDRRFIIPNGAKGPGAYGAPKMRPSPMSPTFSSSSGTLHASSGSGSDCEKGKGKGKETDHHHPHRHHCHHHVKIKGGEDGIPEVPPLKFRDSYLATDFPRHTVINSEAEAFGPDHEGGETTDVDLPADVPGSGAECPGNLFSMIDKISDDGGNSTTDLSFTAPEPAHFIAGGQQHQGVTPTTRQGHDQYDSLNAATLTGDSNWPFDNTGVYGTPGFHGVLPSPPPPPLSPLRRNGYSPFSSSLSPPGLVGPAAASNTDVGPPPPPMMMIPRNAALPNRDIPGYGRGSKFFQDQDEMMGVLDPSRTRTL